MFVSIARQRLAARTMTAIRMMPTIMRNHIVVFDESSAGAVVLSGDSPVQDASVVDGAAVVIEASVVAGD